MTQLKPITTQEMTMIRDTLAVAALDTTAQIQRKTNTRDVYGTETETFATVATVQCGVSNPTASHLANYAYAIADVATFLVLLPYDTDIRIQDHIVIDNEPLVVQIQLSPQSFSGLQGVLASVVRKQ